MWWIVWSALTVGTLVGAFFLGRSLWRKGLALAHEAGRAGEASGRLGERADELRQAARGRNPVPPPALLRSKGEIRAELAGVQARRDARADERTDRRRARQEQWLAHWRSQGSYRPGHRLTPPPRSPESS